MKLSYDIVETPAGDFTIAMGEDLTVRYALFDGEKARESLPQVTSWTRTPERLRPVVRQLRDYIAGKTETFQASLAPAGTAFQQRVWAELLKIPYGQDRTYRDIALALGSSPRAVGGAIGANPISILIPCHRVIATNGDLTGFAWGIERKIWLRRREGLSL